MAQILPNSASFLITEDCNLACKYCFENKRRNWQIMSLEVLYKGLEYLCANVVKSGRQFHAMIFGGEPLLEPDLVQKLVDYGNELAKQNQVEFTASIITNATILTPEIEAMLTGYIKRGKFSIQLSIDGIGAAHDIYRITRGGKGSFGLIEKNIPGFQRLSRHQPGSVGVHSCINKKSLPFMFESYRFFAEEWGFKSIWFMPVHEEDWDENDIELYRSEVDKIARYILDKVRTTRDLSWIKGYSPLDKCVLPDRKPAAPCGAGKDFISITANGDIYPCHHFYFDAGPELKIGDVFSGINDSKRRIFLEYDQKDMNCPADCDNVSCYRCIAVNYQVNGSIISQVRGNYCRLSKIDRETILYIRGVLKDMGLFENKTNEPRLQLPEGAGGYHFSDSWVKDGMYYESYNNPEKGDRILLDAPADSIPTLPEACSGNSCRGDFDKFEVLAAGVMALLEKMDEVLIELRRKG